MYIYLFCLITSLSIIASSLVLHLVAPDLSPFVSFAPFALVVEGFQLTRPQRMQVCWDPPPLPARVLCSSSSLSICCFCSCQRCLRMTVSAVSDSSTADLGESALRVKILRGDKFP